MIELKPGVAIEQLLQQMAELKQSVTNSAIAMTWQDGQRYYLLAVERLEGIFSHSVADGSWYDQLCGGGYWAVREMSDGTTRPSPLLSAEAGRLVRWLEEIEQELQRIAREDDDPGTNATRLVFDTSALVREGSFDEVPWGSLVKADNVRLILPILVVREMDDLKNFGKTPKARRRLRRIYEILGGTGRGPAVVGVGVTLELLMDPFRHARLTNHDQEIVRRAAYLKGRPGGPLKIVTGDYTMLSIGAAEGIEVMMTPEELRIGAVEGEE
jgi:hypothetical protein